MKAFKTIAFAAAICTALTGTAALPGLHASAAAETTSINDIVYQLVTSSDGKVTAAQVIGFDPEISKSMRSTNPEILPSVVFDSGAECAVTSIGEQAFEGTQIESIIIPDSVTRIYNSAFKNCKKLTEAVLPKRLNAIKYDTFYGCTSLSSIFIPDSVESIGLSAFYGCTSLESVEGGKGVTEVDSGSDTSFRPFYNTPWLQAEFQEAGYASIGAVLLAGSESLLSIDIPEGIETIAEYAFEGCSDLEFVSFPPSLYKIGAYAFYGCTNLNIEEIPFTVWEIGDYAFYQCDSLREITVGSYQIMDSAFGKCKNLSDITLTRGDCYLPEYFVYNDTVTDPKMPEYVINYLFYGTIHAVKDSTAEEYARTYHAEFAYVTQLADSAGDLDDDGEITAADAQLALIEYTNTGVAGKPSTLSFVQRRNADIDRDGAVTAVDAQIILKYYVQKSIAGLNPTWENLLYGKPDYTEEETESEDA